LPLGMKDVFDVRHADRLRLADPRGPSAGR
jgi:hypothetical protein